MPKIAELVDSVLELVSDELEITRASILSRSRDAETVDARHMAVRLLHAHGVYPSRIAEIFHLSPRNIHYVITSFDARTRQIENCETSTQKSRNNSEITSKQLRNNPLNHKRFWSIFAVRGDIAPQCKIISNYE